MKLSRNEFVKYVNIYKKMLEEEDEILNVLDMGPEWKPGGWVSSFYDFLSDMCELEGDPTYGGSTLDWWVYETNFGDSNSAIEPVIIFGNETISLNSAEALYDYVMKYEVDK